MPGKVGTPAGAGSKTARRSTVSTTAWPSSVRQTAATITSTSFAATWARIDSGENAVALGACLLVSWVGTWHQRRAADLDERRRTLTARVSDAEATIATLRDVVARLRARADRTATSLSFLREAASRLDGDDPVAAAEGAVDLALARTGARAAEVRVVREGARRRLALRDARGPQTLEPLEAGDADVNVPIRDGGDVLGVLALWDLPRSGLDVAAERDLAVIASWCVPALVGGSTGFVECGRRERRIE